MEDKGKRVYELMQFAKNNVANLKWEEFLVKLFSEAESGNYTFLETITEPGVLLYVKEVYEVWRDPRDKEEAKAKQEQFAKNAASLMR